MMGRIIALDVGDVRIGVAVSDPTGTIAQPLEVYKRVGYRPDCAYVLKLSEQYGTRDILLGLPLNMDGSAGGQAQKVKDFAKVLSDAGLNILFQDERLTTVTAEQVLISGGVHRENRKKYVDKLAAAVILEQYMTSRVKENQNGAE